MYAEQPAQRQRHHEIGEKGYPYHRLDALYAAQGIGEGVLNGVAYLVGDERKHRDRHQQADLGAVGEPPAQGVPEEEYGHREHAGYQQDEVKAGVCRAAHGGIVALACEIAHAHGHGGCHAAVDHVEQLRHGKHYLVGGKGGGAQPAHEDGRQGEGSRLHSQLQGDGETQPRQAPHTGARHTPRGEAAAVTGVTAVHEEHQDARHGHDDARERRGKACAEESQLGRAELSVDKHPVAENVEQVAAYYDEHGRAGVGYAVEKLLESVEAAQERQQGYVDPQIGTHQRKQLDGLSEAVDVKAEQHRNAHKGKREQQVGHKAVLHGSAYAPGLAAPEHAAHNGRKAVREAGGEDYDEREHGVDEAGGSQLLHAVMPNHERIGKPQHDIAYLAHHDRHAQRHQRAVPVPDFIDESIHNGCKDTNKKRINKKTGRQLINAGHEEKKRAGPSQAGSQKTF